MEKEVPNTEKYKGKYSDDEKVDKSLKHSVTSGLAFGVNDGTTNSYIVPYALALGASNSQVAMLTSVPSLLAPLSELGTTSAIKKLKSRKKVIIISALLQSFMILAMMVIPFFFLDNGPLVLVGLFSFYATFGSFLIPAFTSMMGDLVPSNIRGRFFGNRSRLIGFVALSVTLVASYFLDLFPKGVYIGFLILFGVGLIGRVISVYITSKMYDPKFTIEKELEFSFKDFIKKMPFNNFGRFTIYVSLINFAVYFAGPFFTVYMLKDLELSYLKFTILNVVSGVATLIFLPLWGKFSDSYGNIRTLKITGFLIPLVPLLWIFSREYSYLLAVQLFGGFAWAGFNLAAANFLFDSTTPQRRPACDAYSAIIYGVSIFLGASLGGYVATNVTITFMNQLLFIFLISFTLRLLFSVIMLPFIKEVREVNRTPLFEIIGLTYRGFLHRTVGWHVHSKKK